MHISPEDLEGNPFEHPEPLPFHGLGTLEDPFRPDAFEDTIQAIAQLAKDSNEPKYCSFEGSNFRIMPDGTVEWAHEMPPIRDPIPGIIEDSLRRWREILS